MSNVVLIPAIITGIVVVAVVWLNRVTPARVRRFAERFDLPFDDTTERGIRLYLGRAARWRVGGALAGYAGAFLLQVLPVGQVPDFLSNTLAMALVGYLVGAVIGESFAPRLPDAGAAPRRRAIAAERRLGDYVPSRSMRALWVPPSLAAVVLVAGAVLPWHRAHGLTGVHLTNVAIELTLVVVVLIGVALGRRRVLERPQPASAEPAALRLDDALRAASLQALSGAGMALGLLVVADAFWEVGGGTAIQVFRWTMPWLGLAAMIGAMWMWVRATTDARWRQRLAITEEGVA